MNWVSVSGGVKMYRGRGRGKKVLQTTLGTAVNNSTNVKPIDLASLRKPIETSIIGLKQILNLFETATDEVKNYISYECELIYECRTCRSIFRSLANFILHKREYCRTRYTGWYYNKEDNNVIFKPSKSSLDTLQKKSSPVSDSTLKDTCQKSLAAVISKLEARQKSEEICTRVMETDLEEDRKEEQCPVEEKYEDTHNSDVALQEIEHNLSGVFQTLIKDDKGHDEENLIKSEVMEIHSILNNDEVILGPDGKILSQPVKTFTSITNATPNFNFSCKICRQRFSTKKTLTQHIKYKHNKTKVVYKCPESGCNSNVFANTWSVIRHLYKVHRKTSAQVKKMRTLIHSNVVRRGQVVEKPTFRSGDKDNISQRSLNEEWMDSFESDNDLQMCGGCGKRFERKAALNSHSQMCQRRLGIWNATKETRKPEEEKRQEIPKLIIKNLKVVGSQKRKSPHTIRKAEQQDCIINNRIDDRKTIKKSMERKSVEKVEHIINNTNGVVKSIAENIETSKNSTDVDVEMAKTICTDIDNEAEGKSKVKGNTKVDFVDKDSCEMTLVIDIPEEHDEVIIIDDKNDQNHNQQTNLYEPEMILVEKSQIVCVSDDEDQPVITLETKAAPFMDINERKCIPCNHLFETIDSLLKHMATHFKWFHFQCNECLFKSYDHITLQSHLQKHHSITEFERYTIRLTHHEIIKNSVDFQPLFEDDNGERKARSSVCADPSVQKMIMEVIFGNIPGLLEKQQRPVRNRVMPKKDDFVYEDDVHKYPVGKTEKTYSKKRKLLEENKH